jgi:hypothetical protein
MKKTRTLSVYLTFHENLTATAIVVEDSDHVVEEGKGNHWSKGR